MRVSHDVPVVIEQEHVLDLVARLGSFRYLTWPGNLGDALIRFSTQRAFRDSALDSNGADRSDAIVFSGGGNLIPLYNSRRLLDEAADQRHVLVLPHTMRGVAALFRDRPHLRAIARERESWQHLVDGGVPANRVLLSHDAAFWLEPWVKAQAWRSSTGTLMAFREDAESTGRFSEFADVNFDISQSSVSTWTDPDETSRAATMFLEFLSRFDTIVTDRLHVAIGAALLGRECLLFANSYGKNRAIYEMSLRDRFESVRWCNSLDEIPTFLRSSAVGRREAETEWVDLGGAHRKSTQQRNAVWRLPNSLRRRATSLRNEISSVRHLDPNRSIKGLATYARLRHRRQDSSEGIVSMSEYLSVLEATGSDSMVDLIDQWTQSARIGDRLALSGYWSEASTRSNIDEVIDRYPKLDYRRVKSFLIVQMRN